MKTLLLACIESAAFIGLMLLLQHILSLSYYELFWALVGSYTYTVYKQYKNNK